MPTFNKCMCRAIVACVAAIHCGIGSAHNDDTPSLATLLAKLEQLLASDAAGSAAVRDTWDRIASLGPDTALPLLEYMDRCNSRETVNWIGAAVEHISRNAVPRHGADAFCDSIGRFLQDQSHSNYSRRLALEILEAHRPKYRDNYLARALGDPAFGKEAVAWWIERADAALENGAKEEALSIYRRAFENSTDFELCHELSETLAEHGQEVALGKHLGILRDWVVIGPFPGHENRAFDRTYPPESAIQLDCTVHLDGQDYAWRKARLEEDLICDLRALVADVDDAVAFAYTELVSTADIRVELRAGADDNLAVWFNGNRVFCFPYYNNNLRPDRHRVALNIKRGVNTLLLKVAEAASNPNSTSRRSPQWRFVARIVDESGHGLQFPVTTRIEKYRPEERNGQ